MGEPGGLPSMGSHRVRHEIDAFLPQSKINFSKEDKPVLAMCVEI